MVDVLRQLAERRLLSGGSLHAVHDGKVVADCTFAPHDHDHQHDDDHAIGDLRWACISKLSLVVAFARLWQEGTVDPADTVATYIPAFGVAGKEATTLAHLLTHTTGATDDPATVLDQGASWEEALDAACAEAVEPESVGTVCAYRRQTNWFLLAEALSQATNTPPETIDVELGMRSVEVHDAHIAPQGYWPGRSTVGPLADMLTLCAALSPSNEASDGFLDAETRADIVRPWREGMVDAVLGSETTWGLGLPVDARLFGKRPSPQTFGHLGSFGTFVSFDPANGLGIAASFRGVRNDIHGTTVRYQVTDALHDLVTTG